MALNLPRFSSPRFTAIHPSTGRPVSFGWVKFYVAGTTTAKDVYANSDGAAIASLNTNGGVPLDEAGSCAVFLSGPYRVEVYDNNGALVYDADKINSIAVDLATGNPGSLIAANNLSDVDDVPTARASLGLVKQTGTQDATSGSVLLVGAYGIGGGVPSILVSSLALNGTSRVTGWVQVEAADVATVGGPAGAGAGVVQTMRETSEGIAQVYFPTSGSNMSPWRRLYSLGAWTDWRRDHDYGSSSVSRWSRDAANVQRCTRLSQTFVFNDTATLVTTFTFPQPFSDEPAISLTFPSSGAATTSCSFSDFGAVRKAVGLSSATIYITKVTGAANFTAPSQVTDVRIEAVGPWF